MILLIDNYDSFSYNLYQLIGEIDQHIKVVRTDEITIEEIKKLKPDRIILSPGPGRPEDAGIIIEIIRTFTHPGFTPYLSSSSCEASVPQIPAYL